MYVDQAVEVFTPLNPTTKGYRMKISMKLVY